MTLGTIVSNGGKYVRVTLEGATEEGVIETTLQGVDDHLSVLDLRGTGLNPDEIDFPYYVNGEQKIYTDNPRLNQTVRNEGKYVRFTFEGEPASVEKENLDYLFSTGGLVCGADMSVFTGIKSINGINENNDVCDIENLDTSKVVSADYAFRNSGKKDFLLSEYPEAESMKEIINGCTKLKNIEINGCMNEDLCISVENTVKNNNLDTFSALDVDLIEELDFRNTEALDLFALTGLNFKTLKNIPDLAECKKFILRSPAIVGLESLEVGKKDGPLEEISLEIPYLKKLTVSSGEISVFDGNKLDNLEEVRLDIPRLIKIDFSGTEKNPLKLMKFNLSGNVNLRYLDLSYTQIETIDVSIYEKLPYVVFDTTDKKTRKMIEGWKAQNCPNLKKATMLDSQAHAVNKNLSLDNDSLKGCESLTDVVVITTGTVEMTGHETHYAKADFLNGATFKGNETHYDNVSFLGKTNLDDDMVYKGSLIDDYLYTEEFLVELVIRHSGVLGELRYFPDTDFHRGFLYCDGSIFLPEVYPEFFKLWKVRFEKKYGYDRFGYPRLPDFRGMYVRGSKDGDVPFEFEPESLPNINAVVSCASEGLFNGRGAISTSGAFEVSGSNVYCGGDNEDYGRPHTLIFNANKSNRTYGRLPNGNVVVNNINSYIFIKVI